MKKITSKKSVWSPDDLQRYPAEADNAFNFQGRQALATSAGHFGQWQRKGRSRTVGGHMSSDELQSHPYSYHVPSANLDALPEIAVTHPPDTFCAAYGRAQCITTTRFDGHHPTDKIQRISGPPGGPEIRQQHRRRSQRRIWGQELAPSRPQPPLREPPTGGYGRNTTGGWLADDPRVVPLCPRACGGSGAGFGVQNPGINPTGGAIPRMSGS